MFSNRSDLCHTFTHALPFWEIPLLAFVPLFLWLVANQILKHILQSDIGLYVQGRKKKYGLHNSEAAEQSLGCYE